MKNLDYIEKIVSVKKVNKKYLKLKSEIKRIYKNR